MSEFEKRFDSVILAGGFGKRLSPLTDTIPKPLLSIANESAFLRNLKLLRKHGFDTTAVTTMYLAEELEKIRFPQGTVKYFRENTPLGSAGAVGRLKNDSEDCLLILSGDAICDFDLTQAKNEFLQSGCDGGIVLTSSDDMGEYGSVSVFQGKVTELREKPSPRDTLSDLVNTGIYFLSKNALNMIPENQFFDFSKDLFPAMLNKGMTIAGIRPHGHWFDIGSLAEYHRCNMWYSKGENCIGKQVSIHPDARIEYSVILDNCTIGNSTLRGCVIGEGAVIGNSCMVPHGCVIGPGAELRDGSALAPGTIIKSGDTVFGDSFVQCFPKKKQKLMIDDDCIIADDNDDGYYVRLGRLLGGEGKVIAFAQGGGRTLQQSCELACGAAEAGSGCTVISGGNSSIASFAAMEFQSKTAFIYQSGGKTLIRLFSPDGMEFSREEIRKLSSKEPLVTKLTGSVYLLPHGVLIKKYLDYLRNTVSIPKKMKISNSLESKLLRECAEELGISDDEALAEFMLSSDGEKLIAILPDGRELSYWQLLMLCCIEGEEKEIYLPADTPNTVEQILKRHSVNVKFYGDSESPERKEAQSHRLHRDGILLALTVSAIAEKQNKTLAQLAESLPPFSVTVRAIYADRSKMYSVIARLREESGGRCPSIEFGEGRVNVYPSASGRFRLIAEAVDFETAEEISLKAMDMLEKK